MSGTILSDALTLWLLLNAAVIGAFIARAWLMELRRRLAAHEERRQRDRAFWRNLYRQSHR